MEHQLSTMPIGRLPCMHKDPASNLRPCSVIPKPDWIEGDWNGIIPLQACGGLNPGQSTPIPLLTGINEQGLNQSNEQV
jgi:hypothetical protein